MGSRAFIAGPQGVTDHEIQRPNLSDISEWITIALTSNTSGAFTYSVFQMIVHIASEGKSEH
jgi:hypothetical protein